MIPTAQQYQAKRSSFPAETTLKSTAIAGTAERNAAIVPATIAGPRAAPAARASPRLAAVAPRWLKLREKDLQSVFGIILAWGEIPQLGHFDIHKIWYYSMIPAHYIVEIIQINLDRQFGFHYMAGIPFNKRINSYNMIDSDEKENAPTGI